MTKPPIPDRPRRPVPGGELDEPVAAKPEAPLWVFIPAGVVGLGVLIGAIFAAVSALTNNTAPHGDAVAVGNDANGAREGSLPPQLDRRSRQQANGSSRGESRQGEREPIDDRRRVALSPNEHSQSERQQSREQNRTTATNRNSQQHNRSSNTVASARGQGRDQRVPLESSGRMSLQNQPSALPNPSAAEVIVFGHQLNVYHQDARPQSPMPSEGLMVKAGHQLWVVPGSVAIVHLKHDAHDIQAHVLGGSWIEFGNADELALYEGRVVFSAASEGAEIQLTWPQERFPWPRPASFDPSARRSLISLSGPEQPVGVEVSYSQDAEADTVLRITGQAATDPSPAGITFASNENPEQWVLIESQERDAADRLARALQDSGSTAPWMIGRMTTVRRLEPIVEDQTAPADVRLLAARMLLCLELPRVTQDLMNEIFQSVNNESGEWERRHMEALLREYGRLIRRDARGENTIRVLFRGTTQELERFLDAARSFDD